MNLPKYMLLRKQKEYMDYYNKYDNRYKVLQNTPYSFFLGDAGIKYIKYYKGMRDIYMKKWYEVDMSIKNRTL